MIHFRIDIFGWRRVSELYEEGRRKDAKIREMETGQHYQQVQLKGYGKEFERILKEKKALEDKLKAVEEDRDEWIQKYKSSENARKSLGDKLVDTARERDRLQAVIDTLRGPILRNGPQMPATDPIMGGIVYTRGAETREGGTQA